MKKRNAVKVYKKRQNTRVRSSPRVVVSFSISAALLPRLDSVADAQGLNRSQLVERIILEGLEGSEDMMKVFTDPIIMAALGSALKDREVLRHIGQAIGADADADQLRLFQTAFTEFGNKVEAGNKGAK